MGNFRPMVKRTAARITSKKAGTILKHDRLSSSAMWQMSKPQLPWKPFTVFKMVPFCLGNRITYLSLILFSELRHAAVRSWDRDNPVYWRTEQFANFKCRNQLCFAKPRVFTVNQTEQNHHHHKELGSTNASESPHLGRALPWALRELFGHGHRALSALSALRERGRAAPAAGATAATAHSPRHHPHPKTKNKKI